MPWHGSHASNPHSNFQTEHILALNQGASWSFKLSRCRACSSDLLTKGSRVHKPGAGAGVAWIEGGANTNLRLFDCIWSLLQFTKNICSPSCSIIALSLLQDSGTIVFILEMILFHSLLEVRPQMVVRILPYEQLVKFGDPLLHLPLLFSLKVFCKDSINVDVLKIWPQIQVLYYQGHSPNREKANPRI